MKAPKALLWSTYTAVFVCTCIPSLLGPLFGLGCIPSRMPFLHILLIGVPSTVIAGYIGYILAKPLLRKLFNRDKSILARSFFVLLITLVVCIIAFNAGCLFGSLGNFIREYFFYSTSKIDPFGQIIDRILLIIILITFYNLILFGAVSIANGLCAYFFLSRKK